MEHSLTFLINC